MAIGSHNVVVGDVTYVVTTFPAAKGLAYLKRLLKVVGPALAEIAGGDEGGINADGLGKAAELLFDNLDKENLDQMIVDWVKNNVTKGGQPVVFDMEFAQNYGALFTLVKEVIMLNYASVFQNGFGGLLQSQTNLLKPN